VASTIRRRSGTHLVARSDQRRRGRVATSKERSRGEITGSLGAAASTDLWRKIVRINDVIEQPSKGKIVDLKMCNSSASDSLQRVKGGSTDHARRRVRSCPSSGSVRTNPATPSGHNRSFAPGDRSTSGAAVIFQAAAETCASLLRLLPCRPSMPTDTGPPIRHAAHDVRLSP
jgi:hypothetical protein